MAVLFAMGQHGRSLAGRQRVAFLERTWPAAQCVAEDLVRTVSTPTGLHAPAFDLWETFQGSFTYTNAAVSCALRQAAFLGRAVGEEGLSVTWEERCRRGAGGGLHVPLER